MLNLDAAEILSLIIAAELRINIYVGCIQRPNLYILNGLKCHTGIYIRRFITRKISIGLINLYNFVQFFRK